MLLPLRALVTRLLFSWIAVAAAGTAIAAVAAAVEGQPPSWTRAWAIATGPGICIAAAWAVNAWRQSGAHIALASLGQPPALTLAAVAALSAGLAGLAPITAPDAPPAQLSHQAAEFMTTHGAITVRWQGAAAIRHDGARWQGLPRPGAAPPPRQPTAPGPTGPLAAAATVAWLSTGRARGALTALIIGASTWAAGALWAIGLGP